MMSRRAFVVALGDLLDRYELALDSAEDLLSGRQRARFLAGFEALAGRPEWAAWVRDGSLEGDEDELRERLRDFLTDELPERLGELRPPVAASPDLDGAARALFLAEVLAPEAPELPGEAPGLGLDRRPPPRAWSAAAASRSLCAVLGVAGVIVAGIRGLSGPGRRAPSPLRVTEGREAAAGAVAPYRIEPVRGEAPAVLAVEYDLEVVGPLVEGVARLTVRVPDGETFSGGRLLGAVPLGAEPGRVTWAGRDLGVARRVPRHDFDRRDRLAPIPDPRGPARVAASLPGGARGEVVLTQAFRGVYPADASGQRRLVLPLAGMPRLRRMTLRVRRDEPSRVVVGGWLRKAPVVDEGAGKPFVLRREGVEPRADLPLLISPAAATPRDYRVETGEGPVFVARSREVLDPGPRRFRILVDTTDPDPAGRERRMRFSYQLKRDLKRASGQPCELRFVRFGSDLWRAWRAGRLWSDDPGGGSELPPAWAVLVTGRAPVAPAGEAPVPAHDLVLFAASEAPDSPPLPGQLRLRVSLAEDLFDAARWVSQSLRAPRLASPRRLRRGEAVVSHGAEWVTWGDGAGWDAGGGPTLAGRDGGGVAPPARRRAPPPVSTPPGGRCPVAAPPAARPEAPELILGGRRVGAGLGNPGAPELILGGRRVAVASDAGRRYPAPRWLTPPRPRDPPADLGTLGRDRFRWEARLKSALTAADGEEIPGLTDAWRRVDPGSPWPVLYALAGLGAPPADAAGGDGPRAPGREDDHRAARGAGAGPSSKRAGELSEALRDITRPWSHRGDAARVSRAGRLLALPWLGAGGGGPFAGNTPEVGAASAVSPGASAAADRRMAARESLVRGRHEEALELYRDELREGLPGEVAFEEACRPGDVPARWRAGLRAEAAWALHRWRVERPGDLDAVRAFARALDVNPDKAPRAWVTVIPAGSQECVGLELRDEFYQPAAADRPETPRGLRVVGAVCDVAPETGWVRSGSPAETLHVGLKVRRVGPDQAARAVVAVFRRDRSRPEVRLVSGSGGTVRVGSFRF